MRLFEEIESCNEILASKKNTRNKIKKLHESNFPPLVNYYAYLNLNYPVDELLSQREAGKVLEKEAEKYFYEMKIQFMRFSSQNDQAFSQLLLLFSQYYAGTPAAEEAKAWAEYKIHPQFWAYRLFDLIKSATHYALQHPVQSSLLFFSALISSVSAKDNSESMGLKTVIQDVPPQNNMPFFSTSDKEFKEKQDIEPLTELIRRKLRVDPKLNPSKSAELLPACNTLVEVVRSAVNEEYHDHVTRVLLNPRFKGIHCVDEVAGGKRMNLARFDATKNLIFFNLGYAHETKKALMKHEFMHADAYYRHSHTKCLGQEDSYVAPVYPATQKNLEKWHAAFDAGDTRVEEYYQLWKKASAGKNLEPKESTLLAKYHEAAKDCELVEQTEIVEEEEKKSLRAVLATKKPGLPILHNHDVWGWVELLSVDDKEQVFRFKTTQPYQNLFIQSVKVPQALNHISYKDRNPNVKLGEREAWTFMHMPPAVARVFYPEVMELRRAEIKQCAPRSLAGDERDKQVKVALFFASPRPKLSPLDASLIFEESKELCQQPEMVPLAKKGFEALLKLPEWSAMAHSYLSHIAYFQEDYSAVIKHHEIAAQEGTATFDAKHKAAESIYQIGDFEKAEKYTQNEIRNIESRWDHHVSKFGRNVVETEMKKLKTLLAKLKAPSLRPH